MDDHGGCNLACPVAKRRVSDCLQFLTLQETVDGSGYGDSTEIGQVPSRREVP